jgi:integrase
MQRNQVSNRPSATSPAALPVAGQVAVAAAPLDQLTELLAALKGPDATLGQVVAAYLQEAKAELDERTYAYRSHYLGRLVGELGSRPVSSLTRADVKRWLRAQAYLRSPQTRETVLVGLHRALNWGVENRLVRENPIRGLRLREVKRHGRELKPEEWRAILRETDPAFRRFLLMMRLTGARPGELRKLRWEDVDLARGIAILPEHKSARKTGKPRVIVFPPPAVKLLLWLKARQHGTCAYELRRLLESLPGRQAKVRDVSARMTGQGFTYRQLSRARHILGVLHRRIGGPLEGYYVYELPQTAVEQFPEGHQTFVFLGQRGRPWTRQALCGKFRRIRERLGLAPSAKLHGIRHLFITECLRRNLNTKVISTLVGHSSGRMVETVYAHIDEDLEFLRAAAEQATALRAAFGALPAPATDADGQALPAERAPIVEQLQAQLAGLVETLTRRIATLETRSPATRPTPAAEPKPPRALNAAERTAYDAAAWAIAQDPGLAGATDKRIFAYLSDRPEWSGQLPPTLCTFRRYLNRARHALEGGCKRVMRRRPAGNRGQVAGDVKGGAA